MSTAPGTSHEREQSLSNVGDLLSDITQDISLLMRQEVALAKAELKQSATQAGRGAGMLAGAAIAGLMTLIFLSVAGWWALGNGIGRGWAALVVTLVWVVIAAVLAVVGRGQLQAVSGMPATTDTVKKIPDAVKGNEGDAR